MSISDHIKEHAEIGLWKKIENAIASAIDFLGLGTMAFQNSDYVSISGGNIDNTVIGATTPKNAHFVELYSSGKTNVGTLAVRGGQTDHYGADTWNGSLNVAQIGNHITPYCSSRGDGGIFCGSIYNWEGVFVKTSNLGPAWLRMFDGNFIFSSGPTGGSAGDSFSYTQIARLDAAGAFTANAVYDAFQSLKKFTLATLPNVVAYNGFLIDVVDASGGAKICRSDGVNWNLLNTTTPVS